MRTSWKSNFDCFHFLILHKFVEITWKPKLQCLLAYSKTSMISHPTQLDYKHALASAFNTPTCFPKKLQQQQQIEHSKLIEASWARILLPDCHSYARQSNIHTNRGSNSNFLPEIGISGSVQFLHQAQSTADCQPLYCCWALRQPPPRFPWRNSWIPNYR